jgi:hypothetical protein
MTTREVAAALKISPQRVRAMIEAGRFPSAQRVDTPRGPVWEIAPADLTLPNVQDRPGGRPRKQGA